MNRLGIRLRGTLLAVFVALALVAGVGSTASASTAHFTGTLGNGTTWIADVPSSWNGILVLYSHGFGPPLPANAPDAATRDALLARGYALAGSSYDPAGSWWALNTAVSDQFATIGAVTAAALPQAPERVLAFGTSMGGLVSALEAEQGARSHRRRALDVRARRRRDPSQQLPARRGVRDREAPHYLLLDPSSSISRTRARAPRREPR